jgi:hypothetical protein
MTPKACDVCSTVFTTKFCPECGRKYEDVVVNVPVSITTHVQGSKDDGYDLCEKYGVDPKSKLGERMIYLNYDVKLVYEIVDDKLILKQVDAGDGQKMCNVIPTKQ